MVGGEQIFTYFRETGKIPNTFWSSAPKGEMTRKSKQGNELCFSESKINEVEVFQGLLSWY